MFKIFTDYDGVLAEFNKTIGPDIYLKPGYSLTLKPQQSMLDALKKLQEDGWAEIYLCGAVINDDYCIKDRNTWLDMVAPWIKKKNRIYIPYGSSKREAIDKLCETAAGDLFLDDYTPNLEDIKKHERLTPIKVLNGINDTRKSWQGARISIFSCAESLYEQILGISLAKRERR